MTFSRTILLSSLTLVCVYSSLTVFAQEGCNLSDTSASPIQKWKENIDTLNAALRSEAAKSQCQISSTSTDAGYVNYISKVVPLESSVSIMREIYSLSSSGSDFFSEVDSFLDQAGPVQELKPHLSDIEKIERSIIETAQYVGSRCAQSIEIKTDILAGVSGYITTGRTIGDVLVDMAKQTKEVKRFFQILSQGIQTEEYIDEAPFVIASPGFSKDMYLYYSPKYIQECRDNDPRKGAFMDVLKGAFTSGWKYPQAIQVWKDAMALLLYRGSSLAGGATDANKEAQINSIVQARKGGVGNSDIMINSQFFKEFGYRPNSKSVDEKMETREGRAFYESMGYEFIRKVIPSIVSQNGTDGTGIVKNVQLQEETIRIQRLQDLEESLYTGYGSRKEEVALSKEKDPQQASELANVISTTKETNKKLKETDKNVCAITGEQATNVPAYRC